MEWWDSDNGNQISDEGGDLCEKFLLDLGKLYVKEFGRLPTQGDIADTIRFCCGNALTVSCKDEKRPFAACETIADLHERVAGTPGPDDALSAAQEAAVGRKLWSSLA